MTCTNKKIKPFIFIIIGAVFLILLIILIINILNTNLSANSAKYSISDSDYSRFYSPDEDETYFIMDGNLLNDHIEGKANVNCYSANNEVLIAGTPDGEYYVVTEKGIEELGDDFYSVDISYNGSAAIFINDEGELYLYDVANGKETFIADDIANAVISPSGKSIAYTDIDDNVLYVYNGKEEVEIGGESIEPICISDDCDYIYYYDHEKDALYVTDLKDDKVKIASSISYYKFNEDCSEFMFVTEKGTFVSNDCSNIIKIDSYAGAELLETYIGLDTTCSNNSFPICGIKTFAGHYYYAGDNIIYVDSDFEREIVVRDVFSNLVVSDDLSTIYYLNDSNTLYSCKLSGDYDKEKIKSDVFSISADRDCKGIYFSDTEGNLYYKTDNKEPEKIAEDVEDFDTTFDGYCLILTDYDEDEGTLYYSKNGRDKEKITTGCHAFGCENCYTFYTVNYDVDDLNLFCNYDVYLTQKGIKYEKMLESVNIGFLY